MTQSDKQEMISYLQEIGANKGDAFNYLLGWFDKQIEYGEQIEATDEELKEVADEYIKSIQ